MGREFARILEIQQYDQNRSWENIKVSRITTSDDEIIVVGRIFRILVDGKEVFKEGVA